MDEFIEAVEANNPKYIIFDKDFMKKCSVEKSWFVKNNKKLNILDITYFLIKNNETGEQFISIEQNAPCYWFPVKSLLINEKIKQIQNVYNVTEYKKNMPNKCRAFIGTKDMLNVDIDQIVNNLVINQNSEMYIWGSNWDDYPFERKIDNNNLNSLHRMNKALKQISDDYYSIGIRTMYSKSIVTVIDYQGIYIVDINYCSANEHELIKKINSELSTDYPLDMPIDILMLLNAFPFTNHKSILDMNKITETNVFIATLICAGDKDKLLEIKNRLKKLNGHEDQKVKNAAKNLLKNL